MIVILDDTFVSRSKNSEVSFLKEDKYRSICQIIEIPTSKDFKRIVGDFKKIHLLCNHRSLKMFNDNMDVIDGKALIENLYLQAQEANVSRITFSRDMHSNIDAKTIDKDVFYANLKPFLDNYIFTKQIELKILFYGENYTEVEYLSAVDSMMDEISFSEILNFKKNPVVLKGISMVFRDKNPLEVIDDWINKGLMKKEIITLINKEL